ALSADESGAASRAMAPSDCPFEPRGRILRRYLKPGTPVFVIRMNRARPRRPRRPLEERVWGRVDSYMGGWLVAARASFDEAHRLAAAAPGARVARRRVRVDGLGQGAQPREGDWVLPGPRHPASRLERGRRVVQRAHLRIAARRRFGVARRDAAAPREHD